MTIGLMLFLGWIFGLIVGGFVRNLKFGYLAMLPVPIAMVIYVSQWQGANPDKLRLTSALEYFFVPLWPSIGAFAGFFAFRALRSYWEGEG